MSPRRPSRVLSKNALSFFLRQVILDDGAVDEGALPPCAHSVRAVATLAAFFGTGRFPRGLRSRLGERIQSSLSFISVTFPIRWIPVTLSGPLLRGDSVLT